MIKTSIIWPLVKMLIKEDEPSAKDYLRKCQITPEDLDYLENFDQYTLEAIMIYALGYIFHGINESPAVRVSTLVEQLDSLTRAHARMLKERNISLYYNKFKSIINNTVDNNLKPGPVVNKKRRDIDQKTGNKPKVYALGALLVEFLLDRKMITLSNDLTFSETYVSKKRNGKYFIPKHLFAICNFDISLLPIKFNLPMVCRPLEWRARTPKNPQKMGGPKSLSDLSGGYLCNPIGDFYNIYRYNLLSTRDLTHFHIVFEEDHKTLCTTMNVLQSQAFEINKDVLNFIINNYDLLVKSGLLMPRYLASLNVNNAINLLRKYYLEDPSMIKVIKYKDLQNEFMVRIQRARYETFIINLASAYDGYKFYLPAFLDFRGRVYRAGVLHFHERDLARSLIVFPTSQNSYYKIDEVDKLLFAAAAFHFKKFNSYDEAHQWYLDQIHMKLSGESLIQVAVDARDPYQFISKALCLEGGGKTNKLQIPITQDASASAYQIISYFLLDKELAKNTNIIPNYDEDNNLRISDIYTVFLDELKVYLQTILDASLYDIICSRLTRKLIKGLFMPIVYGKTVHSMIEDIYKNFSTLLRKGECKTLADIIYMFFKQKYPGIINLMDLVRNVGWIRSALNKPVFYSMSVCTTSQDYMKSKPVNIWIYDRTNRKRRQVTLRIPTQERDRKKTIAATFANFIHQKDAFIAFNMILRTAVETGGRIHMYTVHDNFITTADYALTISNCYIDIFYSLVSPLYFVNFYIYRNMMGDHLSQPPLNEPFSFDKLNEYINICKPKNLNNKNNQIWEEKINSICEAYKKYIDNICPRYGLYRNKYMPYERYLSINFEQNLNEYKGELKSWENSKYIYCLHL